MSKLVIEILSFVHDSVDRYFRQKSKETNCSDQYFDFSREIISNTRSLLTPEKFLSACDRAIEFVNKKYNIQPTDVQCLRGEITYLAKYVFEEVYPDFYHELDSLIKARNQGMSHH